MPVGECVMADELDDLQRQAEDHRERSVECAAAIARAALAGPGREDCKDCGFEIPEERRKAMPSATRCIACQIKFEHGAPRAR